jgi:2',3'-cyclic-nucleotide 2'-phosphodiesterase (5'-nucleotidase family)
MQPITILHTNDIHGRAEGLARIITVIDQFRADHPDRTVIYMDAGDIEDTSNRLSNLTKGRSMHNILSIAQPAVATVGNGSILRYGVQMLEKHAEAVGCTLLLANLLTPDGDIIPGVQPTTILDLDGFKLGVIGVTAQISTYNTFFDLPTPDTVAVVRRLAEELREQGANAVMVLSHLGLEDDRQLAEKMQNRLALIIGAHSHNLLPDGEWVGDVLVAQAGEFAEHVGRIDLVIEDGNLRIEKASVIAVPETISPDPRVAQMEAELDAEMNAYLGEVIGELENELDWSDTGECGIGNLAADAIRDRMKADVGLLVVSASFSDGLAAGDVIRGKLWEVCDSSGNPGVTTMTGEQLQIVIQNGLDAERAAERPRPLRGRARGIMHVSGVIVKGAIIYIDDQPIDPQMSYRVAASDFELMPNFAYTDEVWNLALDFEVPTIIREVVEDYLGKYQRVSVSNGRIKP